MNLPLLYSLGRSPMTGSVDISHNKALCKAGSLLYCILWIYLYDSKLLEYSKADKHTKVAIMCNNGV